MRALVTGIAGFAGSHLASELLDAGYDVYGTRLAGESCSRLSGIRGSISLLPYPRYLMFTVFTVATIQIDF